MPCDYFPPYQVKTAKDQCSCGNFAHRSSHVTVKELHVGRYLVHQRRHRLTVLYSLTKNTKGSSTGDSIKISGFETGRNRPAGHLHRERYQQENPAYQGRVERIVAQATEGHLCHAYCYDSADYNNNPVTIAEPSDTEGLTFSINFWMRYSTATHDSTDVSVTIIAPIPK